MDDEEDGVLTESSLSHKMEAGTGTLQLGAYETQLALLTLSAGILVISLGFIKYFRN